MATKLVLVALSAMVLTGCAQFEDCPGNPPGTAFSTDSQGGENPYGLATPDQKPKGQSNDGARWCDYVYE
jgi:hypothetical protein